MRALRSLLLIAALVLCTGAVRAQTVIPVASCGAASDAARPHDAPSISRIETLFVELLSERGASAVRSREVLAEVASISDRLCARNEVDALAYRMAVERMRGDLVSAASYLHAFLVAEGTVPYFQRAELVTWWTRLADDVRERTAVVEVELRPVRLRSRARIVIDRVELDPAHPSVRVLRGATLTIVVSGPEGHSQTRPVTVNDATPRREEFNLETANEPPLVPLAVRRTEPPDAHRDEPLPPRYSRFTIAALGVCGGSLVTSLVALGVSATMAGEFNRRCPAMPEPGSDCASLRSGYVEARTVSAISFAGSVVAGVVAGVSWGTDRRPQTHPPPRMVFVPTATGVYLGLHGTF